MEHLHCPLVVPETDLGVPLRHGFDQPGTERGQRSICIHQVDHHGGLVIVLVRAEDRVCMQLREDLKEHCSDGLFPVGDVAKDEGSCRGILLHLMVLRRFDHGNLWVGEYGAPLTRVMGRGVEMGENAPELLLRSVSHVALTVSD
jgi:hypothetical protein